MGAQANCCKQPEAVLEENKFNTLGAQNNQEEKQDAGSPQDNTAYKAEYVTYANPIYQTSDDAGKYSVNANVYSQYFESNQNQSSAANLKSYAAQQAEQQQQTNQLQGSQLQGSQMQGSQLQSSQQQGSQLQNSQQQA